jgi:hypothetical protein
MNLIQAKNPAKGDKNSDGIFDARFGSPREIAGIQMT